MICSPERGESIVCLKTLNFKQIYAHEARCASQVISRMCVLRRPNPDAMRAALTKVNKETSIRYVAMCLLHSFVHYAHERLVGKVVVKVNFT